MCQGFADQKARPSGGRRTCDTRRRCPRLPIGLELGTAWLENAPRAAIIIGVENNKGYGNRFLGVSLCLLPTPYFFIPPTFSCLPDHQGRPLIPCSVLGIPSRAACCLVQSNRPKYVERKITAPCCSVRSSLTPHEQFRSPLISV